MYALGLSFGESMLELRRLLGDAFPGVTALLPNNGLDVREIYRAMLHHRKIVTPNKPDVATAALSSVDAGGLSASTTASTAVTPDAPLLPKVRHLSTIANLELPMQRNNTANKKRNKKRTRSGRHSALAGW